MIVTEGPSTERISQHYPRTSYKYEHTRRTFTQAPTQSIVKILMQGPLGEDFKGIFLQDLLTRSCTRSCKDLLKNFTRISTRPPQDLQRPWPRSSSQHPQENPTRSSWRDLRLLPAENMNSGIVHGFDHAYLYNMLKSTATVTTTVSQNETFDPFNMSCKFTKDRAYHAKWHWNHR